jgi:hypothetical protein
MLRRAGVFSMQDSQKTKESEDTTSGKAGPPLEPGRRALFAAAVGAVALTAVMTTMLVAAWRASEPPGGEADPGGRRDSPAAYAKRIKIDIDQRSVKAEIDALGSKELRIDGYVTNTGAQTVAAADLRCYFKANSGGQTYFDFPLVIDTGLDDLGDGPLGPMSGRAFAVRMGEFQGGAEPSISHVEVINIRLKKG